MGLLDRKQTPGTPCDLDHCKVKRREGCSKYVRIASCPRMCLLTYRLGWFSSRFPLGFAAHG